MIAVAPPGDWGPLSQLLGDACVWAVWLRYGEVCQDTLVHSWREDPEFQAGAKGWGEWEEQGPCWGQGELRMPWPEVMPEATPPFPWLGMGDLSWGGRHPGHNP